MSSRFTYSIFYPPSTAAYIANGIQVITVPYSSLTHNRYYFFSFLIHHVIRSHLNMFFHLHSNNYYYYY